MRLTLHEKTNVQVRISETAIFSDQEKMAGEICRAFESAGVKAPPELKSMFDRFVEEMKAQGKEVHLGGSAKGFVLVLYVFTAYLQILR